MTSQLRARAWPTSASCIAYGGGDPPTLQVLGRADRPVVNRIGAWIRGHAAVGVHDVVVDLSDATECDPWLLTVLSRTRRELARGSGSLMVVGVQLPQFLDALPEASLDEVFIVYDVVRRESRGARHAARRAEIPSMAR